MNKNKGLLKAMLLLIGAILFPFFVVLMDAYITFEHPGIKYGGDKSVPKEDVIRYGNITLRDLRLDKVYTDDYSNEKECYKYFITKKNLLSLKKLHEQLSQFCCNYYKNQTEYDEVHFLFYRENRKMPWFWNNEGFFPDLEMNSKNLIGAYGVNNDGIMNFWVGKKGNSFFNYGKVLKEIKSFSDDN